MKNVQANINEAQRTAAIETFKQMQIPEVRALVVRMRTFEGSFEGYPGMDCRDESLVQAACEALGTEDWLRTVAWIASETMRTPEEYRRALFFFEGMVWSVWDCAMTEGGNEAHYEVEEEKFEQEQAKGEAS